ncbi:hypothetical protein [Spongiimicrobium salis]|uniref:hypothetical protein n=1 Tax=Spongiimicrobium salis TaxID=1667022 RepID=UPI00374D9355
MKNVKLAVVALAAMSIAFTSCESESLENELNIEQVRTTSDVDAFVNMKASDGLSSVNATARLTTAPTSIQGLRDAGISVSRGLESFIGTFRGSDFDNLILASELAISNPNLLLRLGFFRSEVTELTRINREYLTLLDEINNVGREFAPATGPLNRVRNLSELIGSWEVQGFRTGAVRTGKNAYELAADLNNINRDAVPSGSVNGFEITETEFRYTNNGVVVDVFPITRTESNFLFVRVNGREERVFNLPLTGQNGNLLVIPFFTVEEGGRARGRVASYTLVRQ